MRAKIIFTAPSIERLTELVEKHALTDCVAADSGDGHVVVRAYPRHDHTRFALSGEEGVVVLPTGHDPAPIGDLHRHLAHVDARPHHNGRDVGLLLHARHGAAYHPDT